MSRKGWSDQPGQIKLGAQRDHMLRAPASSPPLHSDADLHPAVLSAVPSVCHLLSPISISSWWSFLLFLLLLLGSPLASLPLGSGPG